MAIAMLNKSLKVLVGILKKKKKAISQNRKQDRLSKLILWGQYYW